MMDYQRFEAKTVGDCITEACKTLSVTSDLLEYEIVTEGSSGFLGMGAKPAVINARIRIVEEGGPRESESGETAAASSDGEPASPSPAEKGPYSRKERESKAGEKNASSSRHGGDKPMGDIPEFHPEEAERKALAFLENVFEAMGMDVGMESSADYQNRLVSIDLSGSEMGILIGKRGQTLDALQYLTSLAANQRDGEYVHIKLDTENYRERRKDTLRNLARNIASKVKRTHREVRLEPMSPYERRIIHSALQGDRYVTTHSEGEEPYRRVVVSPKQYEQRPYESRQYERR